MSGREATEAEKERAGSSSTSQEGRTESGDGDDDSIESRGASLRKIFLFFEDDVLKASCRGQLGGRWRGGGEWTEDKLSALLLMSSSLLVSLSEVKFGAGMTGYSSSRNISLAAFALSQDR